MIKTLSFLVEIESTTRLIGKPRRQNIVNSFDYNGAVVGSERLKDEGNVELKNKILDAAVHPAGPTYRGVVNSLTRAFGFEQEKVLKIELKTNSDGTKPAIAPRVDFLADKVILYKLWNPNTENNIIDKEINIYSQGDAGYYLSGLISEINNSECYTCSKISSIRSNTHSSSLIRCTSHHFMSSDFIYMDYKTILSHKNIIKDTLVFDDKNTFSIETTSTPSSIGEYYVNLEDGEVLSYNIPQIESTCSYHYNVFPFFIDYSPVQIFNMNDENFTKKLYNKKVLDSGESVNALLNKEGVSILEKIYKSNIFWGE